MSRNESERPFIHVGEAAQLLDVSERTVWRLLAAKKLPGVKLGGTWVISRKQLIQCIEDRIADRINGGAHRQSNDQQRTNTNTTQRK
jgi:excisionase family DNA binding protein